ncbi:hypothetical protein HYFRA_00012721 [Hymenoscyphus fraxineus]|uniref:Uncharacterized protein n=1 Tax=Hymenoscyphus fraxineus TaxID=746836 RepID=A0A9N9PYP6_9HELO|nr:hypothetical protein HYFRA_00012721 [Hymenoscyphus fraxineus]
MQNLMMIREKESTKSGRPQGLIRKYRYWFAFVVVVIGLACSLIPLGIKVIHPHSHNGKTFADDKRSVYSNFSITTLFDEPLLLPSVYTDFKSFFYQSRFEYAFRNNPNLHFNCDIIFAAYFTSDSNYTRDPYISDSYHKASDEDCLASCHNITSLMPI